MELLSDRINSESMTTVARKMEKGHQRHYANKCEVYQLEASSFKSHPDPSQRTMASFSTSSNFPDRPKRQPIPDARTLRKVHIEMELQTIHEQAAYVNITLGDYLSIDSTRVVSYYYEFDFSAHPEIPDYP